MKTKVGVALFFTFFLVACQNQPIKGSAPSLEKVRGILVGSDQPVEVLEKIGQPSEKRKDAWEYNDREVPKVIIFFRNGRVSGISYAIWRGERLENINTLLRAIKGNWRVIKEPFTNPHAGPNNCYLEDLSAGLRIEVNAYLKSAEEISIWKPEKSVKSIRHYLMSKVGEEYCIGSSCSRVTDPNAWKANQCKWLEDIVKAQKEKSPSDN